MRVELVRTERPGHAAELVRDLARAHDAIFAAGGDGTAMEAAGAAALDGPPVAIVPAGTGNQLARHFAIPRHPARSVRSLLGGVERRIDVARLADGRRFALTAGFGFDVAMVAGASGALKRRLGVGAYVLSALPALFRHRRITIRAVVDGVVYERQAALAMIANVPSLMDGLVATGPDVRMDDGLLDLCVFDATSAADALGVVWRCARRDFRPHPGLLCVRGRDIQLAAVPDAVPQADGDLLPAGALHATVEPAGARFLVPAAG
ncbi:MAG: NAD(+)/NADH kinase [Gemmatimonadetes bacterium]|nr:NAD(+)/NADH kinase [Gemmatimonadota bacterium]MBI3567727.1 NAD(+)/NADH kinase [Gemmatimonadota bacterium]